MQGVREARRPNPMLRHAAFLVLMLALASALGCSHREPLPTDTDRREEERSDRLAELYGKDHDLVVTSLTAKALDYSNRGMHPQSERLYRRIVSIEESGGSRATGSVAAALLSLGSEYEKQGKDADADAAYRRAAAIREAEPVPHADADDRDRRTHPLEQCVRG